jgi:hypothetical protein
MMNRNSNKFQDYRTPRTVAMLFMIATVAATPSLAGIITNGSFTTATTSNTVASFDIGVPTGTTPTGTGTLTGWAMSTPSLSMLNCLVSGGATSFMCGTGNNVNNNLTLWSNGPGLSPDSGNYVAIDGDPAYGSALTQTLTNLLTIGHSYQLTFYQAAGEQTTFGTANATATMNWGVCLTTAACTTTNAAKSSTMSFTEDSAAAVSPWTKQTLFFTATAVTETLSFLSEGPSGAPPFLMLDGVSLIDNTSSQTPEPAYAALIGLGLAGVPLVRRVVRKRK